MSKKSVAVLSLILFANSGLVQGAARESAWEVMLSQNPEVVDDANVGWMDRLILDVLTADQAKAYFTGQVTAEELTLEDGQTLATYVDKRMKPAAHVYIPLASPCRLFDLSGGDTAPGIQTLQSRGDDLSFQGGSPVGCAIPEEATNLVLQLQVESVSGFPARLKMWSADRPEPIGIYQSQAAFEFPLSYETTLIAPVCGDCEQEEFQLKLSEAAAVTGEVVGYFRPLTAADQPGGIGGIHFSTEGGLNNYFGSNSGLNATGTRNSFFGGYAGMGNTSGVNNTGDDNSYFGYAAGYYNTTGSLNAFFGSYAGWKNTEGDENAFFGPFAGYENTTGKYNAFFGSQAGYSNDTGSRNSFFGEASGYSNIDGDYNSFFGEGAGYSNTTGAANAFFGRSAGWSNTTGDQNAFFGESAGYSNTEGHSNSFFGQTAGYSNTTGVDNAFFGRSAGYHNTTGSHNVFVGNSSGQSNTDGRYNSFLGDRAGFSNTTGSDNSFFGYNAGYSNTDGLENSFFGYRAGFSNTTGSFNSFFGEDAGYTNTLGGRNSFFGFNAGYSNTDGLENSFFGDRAGFSNAEGDGNSFFGTQTGYSNTSGQANSFFGFNAAYYNTTGYENSFFGYDAGYSNTVEDGNTFVGYRANIDPGSDPETSPVENATAIGYRAYVSQSNSLVLGSIALVNGAADNVSVAIGTTAPEAPLHVKRTDGTARLLVEETLQPQMDRKMYSLRNYGGVQFDLENTYLDEQWFFGITSNTNKFTISRRGTGQYELEMRGSGRVLMAGGNFDLKPWGDLEIAGWLTQLSDRHAKENFVPLDTQEVLDRVAQLPITEWNFRQEEESIRHIGPMAQDFREAFGLGKDERHLSSMDTSGVALVAIQGLNERLQKKDALLLNQQQRIENLEAELAEIKAMLDTR